MKPLINLKVGIQFRIYEVEQASVNPRRFTKYENELNRFWIIGKSLSVFLHQVIEVRRPREFSVPRVLTYFRYYCYGTVRFKILPLLPFCDRLRCALTAI